MNKHIRNHAVLMAIFALALCLLNEGYGRILWLYMVWLPFIGAADAVDKYQASDDPVFRGTIASVAIPWVLLEVTTIALLFASRGP